MGETDHILIPEYICRDIIAPINVEAIPEGTELIIAGWTYKRGPKTEGISLSLSYREVSDMIGRLKKGLKDPTIDKDKLPF